MVPPDGEAIKADMAMAETQATDKQNNFWLSLIQNVGVPTAVLFYILMSISPRLDRLIELQTKVVTILESRSLTSDAKK